MKGIIVMGPQGSGKSTQAELLAKELGVPHIQAGDILYFASQEKTERGRQIKKAMATGVLVNDQLVLQVMEEQLKGKQYCHGFVLDGFPRTVFTAKKIKTKPDKVFYLEVSDKINIQRLLKRGRPDDTLKVIKKRLEVYHQETEPLLTYYQKLGILEKINGERPIELIHQEMMGRLEK